MRIPEEVARLYEHAGPFATAYLDASRAKERGAEEVRLRWQALRGELAAAGADDATLAALDSAVSRGGPVARRARPSAGRCRWRGAAERSLAARPDPVPGAMGAAAAPDAVPGPARTGDRPRRRGRRPGRGGRLGRDGRRRATHRARTGRGLARPPAAQDAVGRLVRTALPAVRREQLGGQRQGSGRR